MAMVRDPAFWKRFSVAVHADEEAQRPDLKHSYVKSLSSTSSTSSSPSPPMDCHLPTSSPKLPESPFFSKPPPTPSSQSMKSPKSQPPSRSQSKRLKKPPPIATTTPTMKEVRISIHESAISPLAPAHHQNPSSPSHAQPRSSLSKFKLDSPRALNSPYLWNRNPSRLTLSGRPPSRFKFWTNISADPSNRDSWLERQRAKKSRRTVICWAFWLGLLAVAAAVIIVVLYLKSRGIILKDNKSDDGSRTGI